MIDASENINDIHIFIALLRRRHQKTLVRLRSGVLLCFALAFK